MRTRILIVSVVLLAAIASVAYTQQPGTPEAPGLPAPPIIPTPATPAPPPISNPTPIAPALPSTSVIPAAAQHTTKSVDVPFAEQSVDQLLDRLEALRIQKAELEKQEQDVMKAVRQKQQKQSDRMTKLGITVTDPPPVGKTAAPELPKLP